MDIVTYPREPYLPDSNEPLLGFRFSVFFFMKGDKPNSMDIRFRKVSGIKARIDTQPLNEGGQNLFSQRLPTKVQFENLVLERSMMINSKLVEEFHNTLSLFKFNPSNVLVTLLNETGSPITGWLFSTAYPVNWAFSDLNAEQNQMVIETMELAYQRMEPVRL
jgi:phage tail-like protein